MTERELEDEPEIDWQIWVSVLTVGFLLGAIADLLALRLFAFVMENKIL